MVGRAEPESKYGGISRCLQKRLSDEGRSYVEPREAEKWLAAEGLFSVGNPEGRDLRSLLRHLARTSQLDQLQGAERVCDPSDLRVKWRIFRV